LSNHTSVGDNDPTKDPRDCKWIKAYFLHEIDIDLESNQANQ